MKKQYCRRPICDGPSITINRIISHSPLLLQEVLFAVRITSTSLSISLSHTIITHNNHVPSPSHSLSHIILVPWCICRQHFRMDCCFRSPSPLPRTAHAPPTGPARKSPRGTRRPALIGAESPWAPPTPRRARTQLELCRLFHICRSHRINAVKLRWANMVKGV